MKYLVVFLLPLALAFTACGGDNAATEAVNEAKEAAGDVGSDISNAAGDAMSGAKDMASGAMDKLTDAVDGGVGMTSINETVTAVKNAGGDITALSPDVAVRNIESWIAKLGDVEGADKVVEGLNSLKTQLSENSIDGKKVGSILTMLAEETRSMAPDNVALKGLAGALEAGGKKLSGM